MESRDWESLVKILDNIIKEKKYNDALDEIWTTFKDRIYEKNKLEDYYKKDNFGEEFSKISGKGIIAYKIAELASNYGVDKYIEIEEYKKILSNIIKIN